MATPLDCMLAFQMGSLWVKPNLSIESVELLMVFQTALWWALHTNVCTKQKSFFFCEANSVFNLPKDFVGVCWSEFGLDMMLGAVWD